MLHMLADPYNSFSSPIVSHNVPGIHGRTAQPRISIREGGKAIGNDHIDITSPRHMEMNHGDL